MIKKSILLFFALFALKANAQHCATDEVNAMYRKLEPALIQQVQAQLEKEYQIQMAINRASASASKGGNFYPYTPTKNEPYPTVYIPLVVHIVHDFGTEYISDDDVYDWVEKMNVTFRKKNADTSVVIAPFKPYIGNARIQFVLARKDPMGNATKGITRTQHYLTNGGDDQAKLGIWAPNRYMNIWLIRKIGRGIGAGVVAAYATFPASAAAFPYSDGIIGGAGFISDARTYEHEIGHCLNLFHPWNNSGAGVSQACGDDDVDDTPPTTGHFGSGASGKPQSGGNCGLDTVMYDSTCAQGYYKTFRNSNGEVDTANYPDTTNVQNIMDYASGACPIMFTHGQVDRMRAALKSSAGNRDNLITESNLQITGIMNNGVLTPRPDLKPVPEYSIERGISERTHFLCADGAKQFLFRNRSWGDSIDVASTSVQWTFGNGATPATSTSKGNVSVTVPASGKGWLKTTLKVTSNAGDSTIERTDVYAADPDNRINPMNGFFQEFSDNAENEKWPIFNYYNNNFKWQVVNHAGFYDNTSIMYSAFDKRGGVDVFTEAPCVYSTSEANTKLAGDMDDFYTPAFDLSGMKGGICNLNFMYAGMWRTTNSLLMNDTLEIAYSTNCGNSFTRFAVLTKAQLMRGTQTIAFAPLSMNDWDLKSISVPEVARDSRVYFRFRYKPSSDNSTLIHLGTGNNYFIDRINISPFPAGINTLVGNNNNIAIAPNPTSSSAFVVIKGNMGAKTTVVVTDITGKVVYRTEEVLQQNISRVEIPANALLSKGMYMVNVISGTQTKTEKLVVN